MEGLRNQCGGGGGGGGVLTVNSLPQWGSGLGPEAGGL